MPKCRENRRLRLRRRKRYEARLRRLSDRPPLPFAELVQVVLTDLGRPSYQNVVKEVEENRILAHLFNRHNVEITDDDRRTPCFSYVTTEYENYEQFAQADEIVDDINSKRNKSLIKLATMIEADWWHWSERVTKIEETVLVIRRYCWLVEAESCRLANGTEITLSCRYGFRKKTKAELERARDQAS